LLEKMLEKPLPAGVHRFPVKEFAPEAGISVIRVSIGDQTAQFLYAPSPGQGSAAEPRTDRTASGNPLAKSQAVEDALEVSALGYKTKSTPITAYEGKVDITLESDFTGVCTESKAVNTTVRGSGAHSVAVETNADAGIKEGTIFRPADMGPGKKYPILVWGEGACALKGLDNAASMAELASHGYFIIADG